MANSSVIKTIIPTCHPCARNNDRTIHEQATPSRFETRKYGRVENLGGILEPYIPALKSLKELIRYAEVPVEFTNSLNQRVRLMHNCLTVGLNENENVTACTSSYSDEEYVYLQVMRYVEVAGVTPQTHLMGPECVFDLNGDDILVYSNNPAGVEQASLLADINTLIGAFAGVECQVA